VRIIRSITLFLGGLICIVAMLVAGVLLLSDQQSVRAALRPRLEKLLSDSLRLDVKIGDISGLSLWKGVRVTGISAVPTWSIAPQVVLRGRISLQNLDYLGAPGTSPGSSNREDIDRLFQLSALWTPLRLTEFTFSIETGQRTSNQAFAGYKYDAISVLATRYF
jgi:hypothetical protein